MTDSFSYSSRSFCSLLRFRPSSELRYDRSGLFCPASDMCGLTAPQEDLHIRRGIYSTDAEHTLSCNNHANSKQRHPERGQQEPRNLEGGRTASRSTTRGGDLNIKPSLLESAGRKIMNLSNLRKLLQGLLNYSVPTFNYGYQMKYESEK